MNYAEEWKAGFERMAEKAERAEAALTLKAQRLAESQAREAKLREALKTYPIVHPIEKYSGSTVEFMRRLMGFERAHREALAMPTDDTTLREFGLKVARATLKAPHPWNHDDREESLKTVVDAVLRGER